jgi:hypothetical protein
MNIYRISVVQCRKSRRGVERRGVVWNAKAWCCKLSRLLRLVNTEVCLND